MLLYINSSTTIAEQLGDKTYHSLLKDFFSDITLPVLENKGNICQYVGDEVIIAWNYEDGKENMHCLKCFFDLKLHILKRKEKYLDRYGLVPSFKAGIHCGTVIAGEVGIIKRDITYSLLSGKNYLFKEKGGFEASFFVAILKILHQKNRNMNKINFFSGQPVLSQIISIIPDRLIQELVDKYCSDRYYKYFKTRDHPISMLYACFHNCTSLGEVITGIEASYNKLSHLKMRYVPRRSTLADANGQRSVSFFEELYHQLYQLYCGRLPDSRSKRSVDFRLFILDSTTVSLFSDVMWAPALMVLMAVKKEALKRTFF
jgi:hypothetical protein